MNSIFEDFETGFPDENGWVVVNPDNDAITWNLFPVTGNEGNYSAGINLFEYYSIFKRDQLISPPIDLSGLSNAQLSFDHAYAQAINLQYTDSLIVKISANCGDTWTRILELGEDGSQNFVTRSPLNYNFFPAVQDDWCGVGFGSDCNSVDISSWAGNTDVQIMFESVRMVGNNLFIDNVSVGLFTGNSQPVNDEKHVEIFPNPSSGIFTISFQNFTNKGDVLVFNSQGQLIKRLNFDAGLSNLQFDLQGKPKGLYLCQNTEQRIKYE
ncbi:MAG: T9SS type A sorting domain-containing protein [Bacteroidales bacterium]